MVNGVKSVWTSLVWCSLLFLCYVNDMVISTDPDCKLLLYAEDSTILFSHKEPDQEDWLTFILDFKKTFDTLPHELLKSKLFGYGIGRKTLRWIDSFCQRTQPAVVNGETSEWAPVLSGVPQGNVLGPLLFSLNINDICTDIDSEIRLFPDDCVCYREIRDSDNSLKLQKDINRLGCWARKWGMRFQPVNCNIMQMTRKRTNKTEASYTLVSTVLENVDSIK